MLGRQYRNWGSAARCMVPHRSRPWMCARRFWEMRGLELMAMQQPSPMQAGKRRQNERGIIMGSGGPSTRQLLPPPTPPAKGPSASALRRAAIVSPVGVLYPFGIRGVNYTISSACATSAHCIGNAAEMIQWNKQDVMFAGGGEELDWTLSVLFDAMGAMSSKYNDRPASASRAYDKNRDGFVIAGGAGVVVLEELEHAKARGAKIYGELVYGA